MGVPPGISNQNGCTIMKSEIENVIKEMKCGKASGNDDISTEMIKALDDEGIKKITELCNPVYNTGYLPPDMSSSIFVRLPKKVKATECSEYRTLSLMSHILKILLKVILKRNKHNIESVISETQSGFMAGKGTREGIYNIRTIIERYIKCWNNIYLCFIDYENAFDIVKHAKIIECMENLDIDGKDISLIRILYWNQKAYMRTEDGLSPEIHIKIGVRQGVLSPCLFNLYTENIFGAINTNNGKTIGGTTITKLRYADDTVLLAETEEDLQEILNEVNRIGKTFDMKMNAKKTKTMLVSKDLTSTKVRLNIDGDFIKQTDKYTYLGQTITSNGKCDDEILKIIEIARGAFNSMLKSITARHIRMKTRKRIIKEYVWSTR